jgi:hypothetical protein
LQSRTNVTLRFAIDLPLYFDLLGSLPYKNLTTQVKAADSLGFLPVDRESLSLRHSFLAKRMYPHHSPEKCGTGGLFGYLGLFLRSGDSEDWPFLRP